MECCNGSNDTSKKDFVCPKCGAVGKKVKTITPKSLVKETYLDKIRENLSYKYCNSPECEITYFTEDTGHYFTKDDLKVKATVKDPSLDVSVCYCFGHTRQSVLNELKETGTSTVLEDIKAKMKGPKCQCEITNPQGSCCLGNVTAWVNEAKEIYKRRDKSKEG